MNSISRSLRGILILLVAVVIGTVVLSKTVKGSAASETTIAVDSIVATTSTVAPVITAAVRDPKTVKVLVANGSSVTGAAKRARNCLINGYDAVSPVDVKKNLKPLPSAIYAQTGFEAEAAAISTALAADIIAAPLPASLPVTPAQAEGINVIVVVGADLAASVKNLPCAEAPTAVAATTSVAA